MKHNTKTNVQNNMYYFEKYYTSKGNNIIAGIDEAGRGSWAGPLVVAICILPKNYKNDLIKDSKTLSEKKREEIYKMIVKDAIYYNTAIASSQQIDGEKNIKNTTKKLMTNLINNAKVVPDITLIDAEKLDVKKETFSIIKGDAKSITIAAASIIAKVTRDHIMHELHIKYPIYRFDKHKGYGTVLHHNIIKSKGIIKNIHRISFEPMKSMKNN